MYQTAYSLANSLPGSTCFLSRYHVPKNQFHRKVQTLHSVVFKILSSTETFKDTSILKDQLVGEHTLNYVEEALSRITIPEAQSSPFDYYYQLREHQNSGSKIENLPEGKKFLEAYQNIKEGKMDWEESMQLASWYLKQEKIPYIQGFQYPNIVLLHPESINKNAQNFWEALVDWQKKFTSSNIFMIRSDGSIGAFQNEEYKAVSLSEVCQKQASFFVE